MLYYDDLICIYIVFLLFVLFFLTEMSFHIFKSLAVKDKCLFVHIMLKYILFFHCRNVQNNMSVSVCMYGPIYTAHSHSHIYLNENINILYPDI